MGDAADLIIDGVLCEGCGELIDGDAPGYARLCPACDDSDMHDYLDEAESELYELARKENLTIADKGNGHFQILGGARLVNYWPASKYRTAHIEGEKKGRRWTTAERAIWLAVTKNT